LKDPSLEPVAVFQIMAVFNNEASLMADLIMWGSLNGTLQSQTLLSRHWLALPFSAGLSALFYRGGLLAVRVILAINICEYTMMYEYQGGPLGKQPLRKLRSNVITLTEKRSCV
jgi:hypothetical protein